MSNHLHENLDEADRLIEAHSWQVNVDPSSLRSLRRVIEDVTQDIHKGHANSSDARRLYDLIADVLLIIERVDNYSPDIVALGDALSVFQAELAQRFNRAIYRDTSRAYLRQLGQLYGTFDDIQPDGSFDSLRYATLYLNLTAARIRYLSGALPNYGFQDMENAVIGMMERTQLIVSAIAASTTIISDDLMLALNRMQYATSNINGLFNRLGTARDAELKALCRTVLNTIDEVRARRESDMVAHVKSLYTTRVIGPAAAPSSPPNNT